MTYADTFHLLKERLASDARELVIPELETRVRRYTFTSSGRYSLGHSTYECAAHGRSFAAGREPVPSEAHPDTLLDVPDAEHACNASFEYLLMSPANETRSAGVIFLLHGLNERSWEKYYPWAAELVARTGKSVAMLPIAFHMQRAPAVWSSPHAMQAVSRLRMSRDEGLRDSSLSNAALSVRIDSSPQRFFWSGRETLDDVASLARMIREGSHPHIAADATIDFFTYSIGAFFAEVLLMADEGRLFPGSRLLIFCGGPVFEGMHPSSRYILDTRAVEGLRSVFLHNLEAEMRSDQRLAHYLEEHRSGRAFRSMLRYGMLREEREERLRALHPRVRAIALVQDTVMPPAEVLRTLGGEHGEIPHDVHVLDFPYPHSHVAPFSIVPVHTAATDRAFEGVFTRAGSHLAG